MYFINRKLFLLLKGGYLFLFIFYFFMVFPGFTPSLAIITHGGGYWTLHTYNSFLLSGAIELLLISYSIISLHNLKLRLAILFGFLGGIILGMNLLVFRIEIGLFPLQGYQYQILSGFYLIIVGCVITFILNTLMLIPRLTESREKRESLKRKILDLGTQFTRLEIKEISEKCNQDYELIIRIIKNMIINREIYAEYFNSTRTIVINQQANIEHIDDLVSKINPFEKKDSKKKQDNDY